MTKIRFSQLWKESGLDDYYSKMDSLAGIGFLFQPEEIGSPMEFFQSEALNEWLGERAILDVLVQEIKTTFPTILQRAKQLKQRHETSILSYCFKAS